MIDVPASGLVYQKLSFSRNRLEHRVPPVDPEMEDRSGLRYLVDILVPEFLRSVDFVEMTPAPIPVREKPALIQGSTTILEGAFLRLEDLLDGYLEYKKPNFRQNTLAIAGTLTMPFCVREEVLSTTTVRDKQWIIKGGLRREDEGYLDIFWTQEQAAKQRFLTWQPDLKNVTATQEEYLYFVLNFTPLPSQVKLRGRVFFTDGTVSETATFKILSSPFLNDVLIAPVGIEAFGLLGLVPEGKQLWRYEVWLSNEEDRKFSEVRTYFYDSGGGLSRQLLFCNSLGGFDTLRLVGKATEQLKVSRAVAQRDVPADVGVEFSDLYVTYIEGEREMTVSTGYLRYETTAKLEYLQELLLAEEIYLITEKGHLPMELVTNQLLTNDDDADLIARTFTLRRANKERSYSSLTAAPAATVRPTGWRGTDVRHVLDAYGKRTGLIVPARLEKYYLDDSSTYFPYTNKPNLQGDDDYIQPAVAADVAVGSTPFASVAISRLTTLKRNNCPAGEEGAAILIDIPAGKYGGEAAGDADRLAEAEYTQKNTQEYVNQNGLCEIPYTYIWAVPAGHFHYRANLPAKCTIGNLGAPYYGNSVRMSYDAGSYWFEPGSNDLDFPTSAVSGLWNLTISGAAGTQKRLRLYRNGTLYSDQTITFSSGGVYVKQLASDSAGDYVAGLPANLDKLYVYITD